MRLAAGLLYLLHRIMLPIFPTSGFDQSLTTPVLLGVLCSWALTEWFGCVFAGLVVPGYLGAILLLNPRAAVIDIGEAIATYLIARAIGEYLGRTGITSRFFGRERFFLVLLVSVLVRIGVEGAILPRIFPHATFDFSIGLVVVPLAANACWKTGLGRGLVENGLPTLAVYVLLRFLLVPHTNLSLAGFELATENVGASFLASPKAYILLITGAVVAAAANLRYGWDFNGILIPGLLSLVVIEPTKFGATFAEVAVLLVATKLVLRLTPLKRATIEGPRRTVLFFGVDYALRFAFAGIVGRQLPGGDVVGLMGFGYLLPTLLAVKISQKESWAVVTLPAMKVSAVAFALGILLGFSSYSLDTVTPSSRLATARTLPLAPTEPGAAALWTAALARSEAPKTGGGALSALRVAALVDQALATALTASKAIAPELQAQPLGGGVVLFRERFETLEARLGDPAILARATPPNGARLVLLIPAPLRAPETAFVGGRMVAAGSVDAMVVSQVDDDATNRSAFSGTPSFAIARALADRTRGAAGHGLVIALTRSPSATASAYVTKAAVATPTLTAFLGKVREVAGDVRVTETTVKGEVDATIELPDARIAAWARAGADADDAPMSTTAMSLAFEGIEPTQATEDLENVLTVRRLVLDPLLDGKGARSLPVLRLSAASLGYRLLGPTPFGGADPMLLLLPVTGTQRPIAVIAREKGVSRAVVELPEGYDEGRRDVALRLGQTMKAHAILLGFERGSGALDGAVMRGAHAAATFPEPGREATIVLVRESHPGASAKPPPPGDPGVIAVGAWGGEARGALLASLKTSLASLGLKTNDAALDVSARDFAARTVFGDSPIAEVTLDQTAIQTASLKRARLAARSMAMVGLQTYDGGVADIAVSLAKTLPTGTAAPINLLEIARRAALEQSVVAKRSLSDAMDLQTTRAGITRAANGEFLVVVGRTAAGVVVAASPIDPHAAPPAPPWKGKTLVECAAAIARGGSCRVEES